MNKTTTLMFVAIAAFAVVGTAVSIVPVVAQFSFNNNQANNQQDCDSGCDGFVNAQNNQGNDNDNNNQVTNTQQ